jgi:hypothetical protein
MLMRVAVTTDAYGRTPTVIETATLRPAINCRTSPAAGRLEAAEAGVTPVMAWLLLKLLTARRILVADSLDCPPSV